MKIRKLLFAATAIIIALALALGGCGSGADTGSGAGAGAGAGEGAGENTEVINVTITMQDGGVIKLELYPDKAPITVENFTKLAKEGFYDGLIFHRVISGFMIQGGDPEGTGFGGSDKTIKGEFSDNGVKNDISHKRGVISMARSQKYDSASSQFFICHADATFLDGQYAAFGKVVEGMDVVDRIAAIDTDANDRPLVDQVIESITVD